MLPHLQQERRYEQNLSRFYSTETPTSWKMSSAQSLENNLEALQCHFTWDLIPRRPNITCEWNILEDIGTEERNFWLGHIYNLQGFIQYQLGSTEEALKLFNRATETFQRQKDADEGPWLMVNFGNLAWLHHHLGEDEKSQDYLSKVDALMRKFPAPPEEELHPEVCAEKAWTLMKFDKEKKLEAAELFQRAIRMQPDTVEWQSSRAILTAEAFKENMKEMQPEVFESLRSAQERDPDNLYVAALYLEARAAKGEGIQVEARDLAEKVLVRSPSSYSGISPLLRLYRNQISKDESIELAEEALRRYPGSRYLKRAVAICHVKKILSEDKPQPADSQIYRAIRLWEEVIDVYGETSVRDQITLADLYAKVDTKKAEQIYKELLKIEDLDQQMLCNRYAKYLHFNRNESRMSTEYHMRAAEIQVESIYRQRSIRELEKVLARSRDPELCRRIREVLRNQPETQNQ